MSRRLAILLMLGVAAGCGSSAGTSPVAPPTSTGTSAQLLPPTVFLVASQKINTTNNEVHFSWVSSESSFQLIIGSSSGASDQLSTTVLSNTFTWTSPPAAGTYYARVAAKRGDSTSAFSDEQTITIVDIRNMVEAMFFHTGPMSDGTESVADRQTADLWPDGTNLRVLVSNDAGETARANAQTFVDQYALLVGGVIAASIEMTPDRLQSITAQSLPAFTIGIRVQSGICITGALGCANYGPGPEPLGPNSAIVTLTANGGLNLSATAHEMGHTYGMGHIQPPGPGRPEFRFMMNADNGAEQMSDAEKLTITFARAGGLRAGMSRAEAAGRLLINQ